MSGRKVIAMLCMAILGVGVMSAVDVGVASAKAKGAPTGHVTKINASNYGVICTGQSGSTSFSPALKLPGTTAGKDKLKIRATLSSCTATPPPGGAPLTITRGVVTGKLQGSEGTSCLQSIEDGGSLPFSGTLKIKWTTTPKISSGITRVSVASGAIGFTGPADDPFNTLTFPGDSSGTVSGSFSADQSQSFSYSVTNETVSSFVEACQGSAGLSSVTDSGGLADFGVSPSSITVTQTPSGISSVPVGDAMSYTATAAFPDNPAFNVTSRANWSSSDSSVAVFGTASNGVQNLIVQAPGTTHITASIGTTSSSPITLTVIPALAIVTSTLPDGQVGIPYDQFVTATGGYGAYTWSEFDLPDGLNIDPATGEITGTPTTAGPNPDSSVEVIDSYPPQADGAFVTIPITIDP